MGEILNSKCLDQSMTQLLKLNNTQKNFTPHQIVESLDLLASVASEVYAAVAAEEGVFVLVVVS